LENKLQIAPVYQSLLLNGESWEAFLRNSINADHILFPKTVYREQGAVYFAGLDSKIEQSLESSRFYEKKLETENFILYALKDSFVSPERVVLDLSESQTKILLSEAEDSEIRDSQWILPSSLGREDLLKEEDLYIYSDDIYSSYYTLLGILYPDLNHFPDSSGVPFSRELTPSTFFTSIPLAFRTLIDEESTYNFADEQIYDLYRLPSGTFITLHFKTGIKTEVAAGDFSKGYLFARASSKVEDFVMQGDSNKWITLRMGPNGVSQEFNWYRSDTPVVAPQTFTLDTEWEVLNIEQFLLVPEIFYLNENEYGNSQAGISFEETDFENLYRVTVAN